MKFMNKRLLRFIWVGGLNTLFTYLVYLLLLQFTNYYLAFSLSFALGIVIAYALNSFVVFQTIFLWHRLLQYTLVYAFQYALASTLLLTEVKGMGLDCRIAPLINSVMMLPLMYTLNQWFLTRKGKS
jgi:putative flippase GtrA